MVLAWAETMAPTTPPVFATTRVHFLPQLAVTTSMRVLLSIKVHESLTSQQLETGVVQVQPSGRPQRERAMR